MQGLLVLQGRSIAKYLSKVAWFFFLEKRVLEVKFGVTFFKHLWQILFKKNFDKQSFFIGQSKIVKNYQKPPKSRNVALLLQFLNHLYLSSGAPTAVSIFPSQISWTLRFLKNRMPSSEFFWSEMWPCWRPLLLRWLYIQMLRWPYHLFLSILHGW